jgi:SPX domain protein involved in polyphosphate accumulation
MSGQSATMIERREYKYLIDRSTMEGIRAAIRPYCQIDENAAKSPTRTYTIDTLYFDTPDLSLFWANDHEQVDRFKMRIRSYADAPKAPMFLEVKRRINDVIAKSRGKVHRSQWAQLMADPAAPIPESVAGKDRWAVERFLSLARTLHIRPFTLVRYQREPYFSVIDDYARVTFDTNIRAHRMDRLSFEPDGRNWRNLDDTEIQRSQHSMIVLELKFTTHVPLWMVSLARRFGLVRSGYSKYGNSIRAFYQPVDNRTFHLSRGWA